VEGTGQGGAGPAANAKPLGSHTVPHVVIAWTALAGIIDGAKNSIPPINMVLTIFRMYLRMVASVSRYSNTLPEAEIRSVEL
jgi:hypothetical protein